MIAVLVLSAASPVTAQDAPAAISLPGSVNASFGTVGALEPANFLGNARFEQGFTAWQRGPLFVVGFVDVTLRADTRGYAWNNTLPYRAGGKVVVAGSRGVLQAAIGVTGEARHGAVRGVSRTAQMSYWAAWERPAGHVQFPGSTWISSGYATVSEPDNWITTAHVEQGVTAWRHGPVAIVPFAGITVGADTEQRTWNNRGLVDAGLKVSTRFNGAAVDLGVAHRVTRAWQTGETAAAPVVFINVWLGWAPRIVR